MFLYHKLFPIESVCVTKRIRDPIEFLEKIFVGVYLTQAEGQVFGVGSKIFTIAGPVILYGIVTSWVLGLVYWIIMIL